MPRNKQTMPPCAYGAACQRKGCVYTHPAKKKKAVVPKSTREICVHFVSGLCSFGDKCENKHPGKAETAQFRDQCARVPCKFGGLCENGACLYAHDGRVYVAPARKKDPVDEWWRRDLDPEICDPISLEPLNDLDYEPFALTAGATTHYFDGAVLAAYVVSTATFVNPMTREPLTRDDCLALDADLNKHQLHKKKATVTQAFDLLHGTAHRGTSSQTGGFSTLQREATTILQSIFGLDPDKEPEENGLDDASPAFSRDGGHHHHLSARQPFSGDADADVPVSIAEAILAQDDEDDDDDDGGGGGSRYARRRFRDCDDEEEAAGRGLDLADPAAFPSLGGGTAAAASSSGKALLPAQKNNLFERSFAELAVAAPAAEAAQTNASRATTSSSSSSSSVGLSQQRKPRPVVKVPQDLWTWNALRNARAFEIRDPVRRYEHVALTSKRADVVDLHFQSARTAPLVLDAVLDGVLDAHGTAWVVTGTGHHVPDRSHQRRGGLLHTFVDDYLASRNYDFAVANDPRGHSGAFLVRRRTRPTDAPS